jgi:hypothetical protein
LKGTLVNLTRRPAMSLSITPAITIIGMLSQNRFHTIEPGAKVSAISLIWVNGGC